MPKDLNKQEEKDNAEQKIDSPIWERVTVVLGVFLFGILLLIPFLANQQSAPTAGVGGGPEDVINKEVKLSSIPVQEVVNNKVFWIGPSSSDVLLVAKDKINTSSIQKGQVINLTAMVKQVPTLEEMQKNWGISKEEAAVLQEQGIYLSATNVEIVQQ